MTATTFDTLMYAKKLKEAGVSEQAAEIQAETLKEIIEDNYSGKRELKEFEASINLKLAELKTEIIKWVLGVSLGQAAIIISCIKLMH
jgi:hypothetical protein